MPKGNLFSKGRNKTMQKLKRIIATLITAALLVSSFAACSTDTAESSGTASEGTESSATDSEGGEEEGGEAVTSVGNTNVSGLPIAIEPITYTVMNQKPSSDKSSGQNEKDIMTLSTEGTNVSIEWTETTEASFQDTLNLTLATGDGMPDAIMTGSMSEAQVTGNLHNFFALTDDTLRTFAPNIVEQIEANTEGGLDELRKTDGVIYTLPVGVWSEYANWASAIPYIRTEWLDTLGLEVPSTIEELYDVLVAFKNDDPNGNGTADEIPMIFAQNNWAAKLQILAGSWGMAGRNLNNDQWYGRVEDGQYILNINDQRFYDYLVEMNRWYEAGLINGDGFSMTGPEFNSLKQQDIHGLVGDWTPTVEAWESGAWTNLPVLTAEGYEDMAMKSGETNFKSVALNGFAITTSCEEPEGLLRWWDNVHSDTEWKLISRDGPEGIAWEYGEDGTAYVKSVDPLPDGLTTETEVHNTYAWRSVSAVLFTGESAIPNPDVLSADGIRYEIIPQYEEYFPTEHIPSTPTPADATEDFALAKSEIENEVEVFFANSVVNGITQDSWNEYLANLEAFGIDEWVSFYQSYVSGDWSAWE